MAWKEMIEHLQLLVDAQLKAKKSVMVLEAGCGSVSYLNFPQHAYLIGVDISEKQLERNTKLNEKILGDIQYYKFQPSSFDVIICWNVLEHLTNPTQVMCKFAAAIRGGGIIILGLPNPLSLKGLVTKFTPYSFHLFFHRYFYGHKNACQDDQGPFKTYMRLSIAPRALAKLASRNGLKIVYFQKYDFNKEWFQERNKVLSLLYYWLSAFLKFISLGRLGKESDYVVVFEKKHILCP